MVAALALALTTLALTTLAGPALAAGSAPSGTRTSMAPGGTLVPGQSLVSPDGRYRATLQADGRLVLRAGSRVLWATHHGAHHAVLRVGPTGNAVLRSGTRVLWSTGTAGVGPRARFTVRDDGALKVIGPSGVAYSTAIGNRCRDYGRGKRVLIDLSEQYSWMCNHTQQLMTSAVTSGAADLGMGTPTGTWQVQSHQRDRYLYPAAGGAYYVRYWMPYNGDYGMHDSAWQRFPYGSERYRTEGSHGCVHVPRRVMSWLYGWAPNGSTVVIRG